MFVARDDYTQRGNTALHYAARWAHTDIIPLLLPEMSDEAVNAKGEVRALSSLLSFLHVDNVMVCTHLMSVHTFAIASITKRTDGLYSLLVSPRLRLPPSFDIFLTTKNLLPKRIICAD